ncbi:MAG: family intrarane metalloprotease [Flaviaesturariibacter sp.]|nr:family intrarane metalloprotease [Flaviaesturariibacter sp.]
MQTYLKTKPVWIQFILFLGLAFGIAAILFLIGGMILQQMTGLGLADMRSSATWKAGDSNMLTMVRGMMLIQFLGFFLLPSLVFAYFCDPQPASFLGLVRPWKPLYWIVGIALMLVSIPLVEYTGLLNRRLPVSPGVYKWIMDMEDEAARTIRFMLAGKSVGSLITNLIFVAAFAGVGEELFFRGILQRMFIRSFKSPWIGIVIAALAFSFFHFQFFGFVPRFLLGLVLGAIYWYSGSLWPSIIAHFFYDALFIVLAWLNPTMLDNPDAPVMSSGAHAVVMALVSAAITIALLLIMKRNSATSYQAVYAADRAVAETEIPS